MSDLPVHPKIKTILIAEDDPSIRKTLGYFLESLNFEFISVADGSEAIEVLRARAIDLLITDFQMPKMDGIKLLNWCRDQDYHFPVIFISADAAQAPREQIALKDCCATLMKKPIDFDGLERALRAAETRDHHSGCVHRRSTPL